MNYYDKDSVEKDTAQSRGMFFKELPRICGYVLFFYGMLGFGLPWRMEVSREVMWDTARVSLIFGATQGGIILVVG